jgi:hypothetical protein
MLMMTSLTHHQPQIYDHCMVPVHNTVKPTERPSQKNFRNNKEISKTPFQQQNVIGAPHAHGAIVRPTSIMGKSHQNQALHNANAPK